MQQEQISFGMPDGQPILAPLPEPPPPAYEPAPNDPPWGVLLALITWLVSMFSLVVLANIPALIYVASKNIPQSELMSDPTTILIAVIGVIPAHIFTLIFCWYISSAGWSFPLRKTLGFSWGGFNFGYCLLAVIFFYGIFGSLLYYYGSPDTELTRILSSSKSVVFVMSFLAVATAPLVEEVVYRGILYSSFQRAAGVPFAILATTFLFAIIHVPQYKESWVAILMIAMLSLGLTLIRWKSDNLLPCIITHMLFNGIQALVLVYQALYGETAPDVPVEAPAFISCIQTLFY